MPTGSGVQVGDRCYQGDQPPRPGLVCLPAFVTIDGFLREEWDYETSYIFNARKGDAVLSAGCGLIANLLRSVDPAQSTRTPASWWKTATRSVTQPPRWTGC